MWRKIIDDCRLDYLNDLFKIKLIFFTVEVLCCNFAQFVWVLSYSV